MENKPREQIAIALFTGAIITLPILIMELVNTLFQKVLIILILIILLVISLKVILYPHSTSLDFFGRPIKKILNGHR